MPDRARPFGGGDTEKMSRHTSESAGALSDDKTFL
jgi:hypothetical protein